MKAAKTVTPSVQSLEALLAQVQAELAALKGAKVSAKINVDAVAALTATEWRTIQMNLVQRGKDNSPIFDRETNSYKLFKGADVKDYMFCKGFVSTLKAREAKGEAVKLGTEINPKTGYSQLRYATETIERLIAGGFVKPERFVASATKSRKSSK